MIKTQENNTRSTYAKMLYVSLRPDNFIISLLLLLIHHRRTAPNQRLQNNGSNDHDNDEQNPSHCTGKAHVHILKRLVVQGSE